MDQSPFVLRRCKRPLLVANALARFSILCFVPKVRAAKVAVKLWKCRIFGRWVKWRSNLKPIVYQSLCRFETILATTSRCQRTCPMVYITFRARDIGPQICHWVAKSSKIGLQFICPDILEVEDPEIFTALCYRSLPSTVWQSLVEFCGLKCVCKARQWRETQNFRTVGRNGGPVWSHLWTEVHDILEQCRRPLVVVNACDRLSISFSFPKI